MAFLLGVIHLVYTFSNARLLPRDPNLRDAMSRAPLSITKETSVLRAWVGFNASHSMALIFFALVFGYLVLVHPQILIESRYLIFLGAMVLAVFALLAKFYWFSIPFFCVMVALFCYLAGAIAAKPY